MVRIVNQVDRSTTSVDYETGGVKKILMSNNISALDVVGRLGDNAMLSSLRVVRLASEVRTLLPSCFMGCEGLADVQMPPSCQYLEDSAFYGCRNLSTVNSLQGDGLLLRKIGRRCFAGCDSLADIALNLGSNADNLCEILGNECFASCENLQSVRFTGMPYASSRMFADCPNLTSITLANKAGYAYPQGFADIPSLEEIVIPPKTWIVNDGMFKGCESLSSVVFTDLPTNDMSANVALIGDAVFEGCDSLHELTLPRSITSFAQLGDEMLGGSSISCVRFNGIPQEYFGQYEVMKKLQYKTGQWHTGKNKSTLETVLKIAKYAHSNRIPTVIQFSRNESQLYDDSGNRYADHQWIKILGELVLNPSYFFMKVFYDSSYSNGIYDWVCARCGEKFDMQKKTCILLMWNQSPKFKYQMFVNAPKNRNVNTNQQFNYTLDEFFKGYVPPTTQVHTIDESSKVSLLGLDTSCVYYASDGSYRTVMPNGGIAYSPKMLVDEFSTANFKTGTWYYNAEELKKFADQFHIPVVIEYSSKGCTPCEYWAKNSFNDKDFQAWFRSQRFLFCRVEKKSSDEAWNDREKSPQLYYTEYQWVRARDSKIPYPPVFCWYWNRADGTVLKEVSSYHFDQGVGALPPWTDQEFFDMTSRKFSGYAEDQDVAPGLSAPAMTEVFGRDKSYPQYRWYENQFISALPDKLKEYYRSYDYVEQFSEANIERQMKQLSTNVDSFKEMQGDELRNATIKYIRDNYYHGELDPNGAFFVCERKEGIQSYGGPLVLGSANLPQGIAVGDSIDLPDATYQVFLATRPYKYDADSLVFRVRDGKTEYLFRCANYVLAETEAQTGYLASQWVKFSGSAPSGGVGQLIDQAERQDVPIVIALVQKGSDSSALDGTQISEYVARSGMYWLRLDVDSLSELDTQNTAASDFKQFINRGYVDEYASREGWDSQNSTNPPCVYLYKACSSCSSGDPIIGVFAATSIAGMDPSGLIKWIDGKKSQPTP